MILNTILFYAVLVTGRTADPSDNIIFLITTDYNFKWQIRHLFSFLIFTLRVNTHSEKKNAVFKF